MGSALSSLSSSVRAVNRVVPLITATLHNFPEGTHQSRVDHLTFLFAQGIASSPSSPAPCALLGNTRLLSCRGDEVNHNSPSCHRARLIASSLPDLSGTRLPFEIKCDPRYLALGVTVPSTSVSFAMTLLIVALIPGMMSCFPRFCCRCVARA